MAELKASHAKEVAVVKDRISTEKDSVIVSQGDQLQTVSNSLYGAGRGFLLYKTPTRVDWIIHNRVEEAAAATGKKATAEAMEVENKRLEEELDENKTSMATLQKKHDSVVLANTKLVTTTEAHVKEIASLNKTLADKDVVYNKNIEEKQNDLNTANDKIIALEKLRADDAEWVRKMKLKIMSVLGILSLACVAGAIWSPVFKSKFAIASAVFAGAAMGVMFVQPWQLAVAAGVVMVGIAAKMVAEHNAVDKTATNAIQYIQSTKPTDTTTLKDYMGKYVAAESGSVRIVTDPAVEKVIQEKLMASHQL